MNSLERIFAAVEGKPVDRPAVTLTLSLYGSKLTGCPVKEYYTNPQAYADGQSAVIDKFQPDLLFSPFSLAAEGEAFGSKVTYLDNYAPNIARPAVGSAEEAIRLNIPDVDSHPRLLFIRESIRLMASQSKGEIPIAAVMLSPVDLPALIMGIGPWLETLLCDELAAKRVIDMTTRFFIKWANSLLSDGANVLMFPCNFSNPEIVTEKILKEKAIPVYQQAFSEIQGPLVLHHGGARIGPFIEHYNSLPNIAAFVIDSRDTFSESRQKVGQSRTLLGNIDGPTLLKKDPQTISDECKKLLQERCDDRHFIMATSNADVAYDTPVENIQAMIQTAKNF
jgi:uroporphyrinogen decarboxylase